MSEYDKGVDDGSTDQDWEHIWGEHETLLSEGAESNLHEHIVGCTKSSDHLNFIPVDEFSLEKLPEGYRDEELYRYISMVSDLTVKLDVRMTSPERPDFWPGTAIPYPFSNMRGAKNLRTGTGRVGGVAKNLMMGQGLEGFMGKLSDKEECPCKKCKSSDRPSRKWGNIMIYTAAHVVFDALKAENTTVQLFYDTPKCPIVTIRDVSLVETHVRSDTCHIMGVTCDPDVVEKLGALIDPSNKARLHLMTKYKSRRTYDKLAFIVSHPHGCSKQVSLGHWQGKYETTGVVVNSCKFTYSTGTWPGSSGASVNVLGYSGDGVQNQHVHSGALDSIIGVSSIGGLLDFEDMSN